MEVVLDKKEWDTWISKTLNKIERPRPLLKRVEQYLKSVTMSMFRGTRADRSTKRGVSWPKLKDSTIKQKKSKMKRGKSISTRPMVDTGKLRDSIKILERSDKGFMIGSKIKSRGGFSYGGFHNIGKFKWLFITNKDKAQIAKMIVSFLNDKLNGFGRMR